MKKNLNRSNRFGMRRGVRPKVSKGDGRVWAGAQRLRAIALLSSLGTGCSGQDETLLLLPDLGGSVGTAPAYLGLPPTTAESASSPALLSETQAFSDLGTLQAAPALLPYSVQSPLWSDGAQKRRWLALPEGGVIGYSEHGAWSFPEGTVLVKHFGMALDERAPDDVRRLETRFLVAARGGGYYGLVYKWDDEQRDARLLLDGAEEVLDIVQADGSVRQQPYSYPSQQACNACHSAAAGYVMGPRTAQLNGNQDYGADGAHNQLAIWASLGLFDAELGNTKVSEHDQLVPLTDETASVEARVRSYWDANCSACHNDVSPIPSWDARFSTALDRQGVLLAEPYTGPRMDDARLIVPGEPERSLIYLRSQSTQPGVRMPPLLKNRMDESYVALLRRWIESLPER
jgi:uncharacterized repeat protein (TIGR03806 family)